MMETMNTAPFSLTITDLLTPERVAELGRGVTNEAAREKLAALTPEKLFAPYAVARPVFAQACLSALWLYHDFLDEAHSISQSIETPEGSFWHGIMHRREGDYGNARYWFRRVGRHPVFDSLGKAAQELAESTKQKVPARWDPLWFIDFCEGCVTRAEPGTELGRRLQQQEWILLFSYCHSQALA
jgi:hypothetical protein